MNVAIVHYHLNRGGVTQVIANHLRALDSALAGHGRCRVALFYGGQCEGWPVSLSEDLVGVELSLHEVPELHYDSGREAKADVLADRLRGTLQRLELSPEDTVLHVHNHCLGKNISLPHAVLRLAGCGYPLLLQIHDFAEDFRPENYRRMVDAVTSGLAHDLPGVLYAQAPHIHYAVLNGRDFAMLERAGVRATQLHALPNPVSTPGRLPSREEAKRELERRFAVPEHRRYFLYPVRGIRRKNIGEALLWALLARGQAVMGLTLAPLNPVEIPSYRRWRALASQSRIPCLFEVGEAEGLSFLANLAAADSILTTSVSEGFGMVFLESWLVERPLVGRDLPEITADFVQAGVQLDSLSSKLLVPIDLVDLSEFRKSFKAMFNEALVAYGREPVGEKWFHDRVDALVQPQNAIDFALLDSQLQRRVIESAREQRIRSQIHRLNPTLDSALTMAQDDMAATVENNAGVIRKHFSLGVSGQRLHNLYRQVLASPRNEAPEAPERGFHILDSFLDLSRLQPIRLER